jgi:hypothetical protein
MRHFASIIIAAAVLFPALTFGSIAAYSNTTTDTFTDISYIANGFSQIGDEITLAETGILATAATVQFYSNGSAGTFDATLQLFNIGSPVGAQIGPDFVVTGIPVTGDPAGDEVNVTFSLPNLSVPESLIFAVSISNQSAGVFVDGLELYDPPTLGSSNPSFAIATSGSGLNTVSTTDNLYFELDGTAVPEPRTVVLAGSALVALVLLAARRRPVSAQ